MGDLHHELLGQRQGAYRPPAAASGAPRPGPRPPSARQRAIYRRRRILAALLLLAVIGLAFLGVQAVATAVSALTGPTRASAGTPPVVAADDPVRLTVPAGTAGLPLSPVAVQERALVDPPEGQAVWYVGGDRVTPGELGTAVIVGDVTDDDGAPTSFADVTSLTEGDRVVVTFGDGVTLELDVVSASVVDPRELESSEVVWGTQAETRRVALVTSDEMTDGDVTGRFLAVAELG